MGFLHLHFSFLKEKRKDMLLYIGMGKEYSVREK